MTRWTMRWRHVALALLWTCLALGAGLAHAHKPSDSYLSLTARDGGLLDVSWHVALRDLDGELSLDANDDGRLTWAEVRTRWADMLRYVRSHLDLSRAAGVCELVAHSDEPPAVIEHSDGQYAVFNWSVQCPVSAGQTWADLDVAYHLFALTDPTHRGIVRWRVQGASMGSAREVSSVVLGVSRPQHHLSWTGLQPPQALPTEQPQDTPRSVPTSTDLAGQPSAAGIEALPLQTETHAALLLRYVREGVTHIAEGTDHILFLVSLLLVSVWRRAGQEDDVGKAPGWGWLPRERWRGTIGEVLRLVTAFTLAHSITLALAAFGVVSPPSRWVESLSALSVLLAALDNLWPLLHAPRWVVVFAFGLVHGFGFAGAMQDLGLSRENLAWPLLGFNLGVELGQLMLVAVVLPLAFSLRRSAFYRLAVVRPGSVAIAALALLWLYQRAADVSLGWVPG